MQNKELNNYFKIQCKKLENDTIPYEYEDIYDSFNKDEYPFAGKFFAIWHKRINDCFELLNQYISQGWTYFHADKSRQLMSVFNEILSISNRLEKYGISFNKDYQSLIDECFTFLAPRGSTIPNSFEIIELLYIPIFYENGKNINHTFMKNIKLIGEGSYAKVYKYTDENYNTKFAYKELNTNATAKEFERFRQEYNIMKSNPYPYVLTTYSFFEKQRMYIMEYMDCNLKKYIEKNNSKLDFKTRKSITLQLLKGIAFLHSKGILHRDISYNNILLSTYEDVVVVKLCDFGLAKDEQNQITSKKTSIKGTYIDPTLASFGSYNEQNEIYSLGFMIWYIFTGKENFDSDNTVLSNIVEKCITVKIEERYKSVKAVLNDIIRLKSINSLDNDNFSNDINAIKNNIISYLASYSANELPDVCEALGLKPGTTEEAYKSKASYVRKRLYSLDGNNIAVLVKKIKDNLGDDVNNYSIEE